MNSKQCWVNESRISCINEAVQGCGQGLRCWSQPAWVQLPFSTTYRLCGFRHFLWLLWVSVIWKAGESERSWPGSIQEFSSSSEYFFFLTPADSKTEFGNNEFMIQAAVSSWSCFRWLYRASPSLAAKNIINLISVLTIWWCPCVESSPVLLEETSVFSWQNSISLCPDSFCTPRPNLPVTPGISWLPTFAFQSPIMKRTSFLGVSSRRSCRSS